VSLDVCVCIPARNEADRIATLIDALAIQHVDAPFAVALCVNNSSDDTARIAQQTAARSDGRFTLIQIECHFEPSLAHAGSARRAAMELGVERLGSGGGLLISTDADCRPPPEWIAANLAASAPERIIGGRIELDEAEVEEWPAIFAFRRHFDAYWQRVRAIEDSIDPSLWDKAPRHGDHTGASLALSVSLYRRSGGVPLQPSGEDRALVEAAIVAGGRLVHPQTVWTRTSARTVGRATGGMAEDLQRWSDAEAIGEVPNVPDFKHWEARARWRRDVRRVRGAEGLMEAERLLPPMPCDMALPMVSGS
jgi:hypothetical protein